MGQNIPSAPHIRHQTGNFCRAGLLCCCFSAELLYILHIMADAAKQAAFDKAVKDPVYMNDQGYMLYNPAVDSNTRCKRRWVDYQRIRADAVNAALSQSSH